MTNAEMRRMVDSLVRESTREIEREIMQMEIDSLKNHLRVEQLERERARTDIYIDDDGRLLSIDNPYGAKANLIVEARSPAQSRTSDDEVWGYIGIGGIATFVFIVIMAFSGTFTGWNFGGYIRNFSHTYSVANNSLTTRFSVNLGRTGNRNITYTARILDSNGNIVVHWSQGITRTAETDRNWIFTLPDTQSFLGAGQSYRFRVIGTVIVNGENRHFHRDFRFTHSP
ncbi:MAG: hypothetical protein FWG65_03315 [Turicibacter sp.]|nr:hypothetical protein [Turicibacter sp.]